MTRQNANRTQNASLAGRRWLTRFACLALAATPVACAPPEGEPEAIEARSSALTTADVAYRWAPVHYQDVYKGGGSLDGAADAITRFNYDNNWNGWDNWENLGGSSPGPAAYYRVVETSTHFLISYIFFHPRDWDMGKFNGGIDGQEHENDMEGVVEFIRKDGGFGQLEGMVTVYHNEWLLYKNPAVAPYLGTGIAGPNAVNNLLMEASNLVVPGATGPDTQLRPMTNQQPQGHGLSGCVNPDQCGFSNNDSYRYVPTTADNAPLLGIPADGKVLTSPYSLIEISSDEGLWTHRFERQAFASWQNFRGDNLGTCGSLGNPTCSTNAAGTPWGTASGHDDDDSNMFFLFADPAQMIAAHFSGFDNANPARAFSTEYTTDNTIGTAHSWGGAWIPAEPAGATDKTPALATLDGRMYLFTKAAGSGAQRINFSTYDGTNWKPAVEMPSLGVTTDVSPGAVTCNGKMYVVVKAGVGAQTMKWNSKSETSNPSTGWGTWAPVPYGVTDSPPALACRGTLVWAFVRGTDSQVWKATLDTTTNAWTGWSVVFNGTTFTTNVAPAAIRDPRTWDVTVVAVNAADKKPYMNSLCEYCPDFQGWRPHDGWTVTSSPVALASDNVPTNPGGIHMFTRRDGNNRIEEDTWLWVMWRGPGSVRGHQYTFNAPAAIAYDNTIYTFATGSTDTKLYFTRAHSMGKLLSQGKSTWQTSTYDSAGPERAVDGRTDSGSSSYFDGHIAGVYTSGFVTHTNAASKPMWRVDLGSKRTINQVDVYNRTDSCCMSRLREWSILVSDDAINWTPIFRDSTAAGAGRLTTLNAKTASFVAGAAGRLTTGPWSARYVAVQINRDNEYLHLGEVQVWGN